MEKGDLDVLGDLIYSRDLDGIKKEVMHQLVLSGGEHDSPEPEQRIMPKDWHEQLVLAKAEHDKYGVVATNIIMPLKWATDFNNKISTKSDTELNNIYSSKHNSIYGAYVSFGPCETIIAASTECTKSQ